VVRRPVLELPIPVGLSGQAYASTVKNMSSHLTVLGGCGGWPEGGRACNGFVLVHHGFRVVLDLGYGTLPRLLALLGSPGGEGIDAVIATHRHPDHMIDLHGLLRARRFTQPGAPAIPLYAPGGVMERLAGLEENDGIPADQVFDWHQLPAPPTTLGPFRLESMLLPHYVPNAGVRLTAPGLTVAYTGDTGPDPALATLGRHADLYIVDATSLDQQPATAGTASEPPMLLTAHDAGQAAHAARASRLLLTHFWPGNNRQQSQAEAAEKFTGPILTADENLIIALP
jgi:ribonuclease BN (tRNA processing enzyme)